MYDTPQSRGPLTVHIRPRTVEYRLLASSIPYGHDSPSRFQYSGKGERGVQKQRDGEYV